MQKPAIRSTILRTLYSDLGKGIWLYRGGSIPVTESMLLGTVAHCLLLEPSKFDERFSVTSARKGSKENDEIIKDGRTPIKNKMYDTAYGMRRALMQYLDANGSQTDIAIIKNLVENGSKEELIEHEEDGFLFKIIPDAYNSDYMLDFKTTSYPFVTKRDWEYYTQKVNYDIQLAFYADVLFKAKGLKMKGIYHIVQSTVEPYLVSCFFFSPESVEIGLAKMQKSLALLLDYIRTPEKVHTIRLENLAGENFLNEDEDYNKMLIESFDNF